MKIEITKEDGLTFEALHLLELATNSKGFKSVEDYVLSAAMEAAEEVVSEDIEYQLDLFEEMDNE